MLDQMARALIPKLERIADMNPNPNASEGTIRGNQTKRARHLVPDDLDGIRTVREVTAKWMRKIGVPPERVVSIGTGSAGLRVVLYCAAKSKPHVRQNCPRGLEGNDVCVEMVTIPWDDRAA